MRSGITIVGIIALMMFSSLMTVGFAEEKDHLKADVPDTVLKAFKAAYPDAKITGTEVESLDSTTVYEIECKIGDVEESILYSADGSIIEIEKEITVSSLPEVVTKAIGVAYPDGKIDEADIVSKGEIVEYELVIEVEEEGFEVMVSSDGKIISSTQISADDEDNGAPDEDDSADEADD